MTYCETCLEPLVGKARHGGKECQPFDPADLDKRADRLLLYHQYRIQGGYIWHVRNDDPDNFQEDRVAPRPEGGLADVFRYLMAHQFPTSDLIDCRTCHMNPVEFLGDDCYECALEKADWGAAEVAWERANS